MTAETLTFTPTGERDIVMRRVFDAPRSVVFDCHVTPDLLKRWLTGPEGWWMEVCEVDLRVGGAYRWSWRNAEGATVGIRGIHHDVAVPERIGNTQRFDHDPTGGEAIGTLVLAEKDGRTILTNTVTYPTREARDAAVACGMEKGVTANYNNLAALLVSLASQESP